MHSKVGKKNFREVRISDILYEQVVLHQYDFEEQCVQCAGSSNKCCLSELRQSSAYSYAFSPYLLYDLKAFEKSVENDFLVDSEWDIKLDIETFKASIEEIYGLITKYAKDYQELFEDRFFDLETESVGKIDRLSKAAQTIRKKFKSIKETYISHKINRVSKEGLQVNVIVAEESNANAELQVLCPFCNTIIRMHKNGKISNLLQLLTNTVELRRSAYLKQAGILYREYPTANYTRFEHALGSWIVAFHTMNLVHVHELDEQVPIPLYRWLDFHCFIEEFLCLLLLHDIGHPPFSHTLEINPALSIDHEEISRGLIIGRRESLQSWDQTNRCFLHLELAYTLETIRNLDTGDQDGPTLRELISRGHVHRAYKHSFTSEVLRNFGIDVWGMTYILSDNIRELEVAENEMFPRSISFYKTIIPFVEGRTDIDRIDHIFRDSFYTGLKLFDINLSGLLSNWYLINSATPHYQSFKHPKPDTDPSTTDSKQPLLHALTEKGILQGQKLLSARQNIYRDVLWADRNMFLLGTLNMIIHYLVTFLPLIKHLLPHSQDESILLKLSQDELSNTIVEKLYKVFNDNQLYGNFRLVARWKITPPEAGLRSTFLKALYQFFSQENGSEEANIPEYIFYAALKTSPTYEKDENRSKTNPIIGLIPYKVDDDFVYPDLADRVRMSQEFKLLPNEHRVFYEDDKFGANTVLIWKRKDNATSSASIKKIFIKYILDIEPLRDAYYTKEWKERIKELPLGVSGSDWAKNDN